jgi:DNA-binding NarL/FixJ family response regulator
MDSLRVILADDHPFVLRGVKSALSTHRDILIVGEAPNPFAAIRLLQTVPCDVFVTDLSMPEAGNVASVLDKCRSAVRFSMRSPKATPVTNP